MNNDDVYANDTNRTKDRCTFLFLIFYLLHTDDPNSSVHLISRREDPRESVKDQHAEDNNNTIVPHARRIYFQLTKRRETLKIRVADIHICTGVDAEEKESETMEPHAFTKSGQCVPSFVEDNTDQQSEQVEREMTHGQINTRHLWSKIHSRLIRHGTRPHTCTVI